MDIICNMKKAIILFILVAPLQTNANPMFAHKTENSIGVFVAQSTGQGNLGHLIAPWDWRVTPMTMIMVQYSQPISLFRLPSRINLIGLQNFAYNSADGASFGAAGISLDVALFNWCGWYAGVGLGPYMRDSGDRFVESRLVFGERVFIGKNVTKRIRAEFFTQHFSNGDFTELNRGFNFAGLAIHWCF